MNVPLTNAIMDAAPAAHAGVASALLNTSREVSGLLGVTLLGAVLRSRESSSLRGGGSAGTAVTATGERAEEGTMAAPWS